MKPFYLLGLFTVITTAAAAQMDAGFSYSLALPQQEMRENIKPVHSINGIFLSRFKGSQKFSWGAELGFGSYAFFTKQQDIRFPDGSGITTDVTYSSNMVTGGLVTRYNFFKRAKVNPYLNGKIGIANLFSKVIVLDPEDEDDCKPLDKKTPINDVSFYAAYGGGVLINLGGKGCRAQKTWLDISVNQLMGSSLDYINVKDIKEHVHNDPNNPIPSTGKSSPLNIRFVNVATQTIHEHQLAEVYTSPLRLLEFKVAVIFRLE